MNSAAGALLLFVFSVPTAAADAPSELEILSEFLAPGDSATVQGEHCRRWGGISGDLAGSLGLPVGRVGIALPPTNLFLQHHVVWHEKYEVGRTIDDAYRSEDDPYGTRFRELHQQMLGEFNAWRLAHGYGPVGVWDPATPISPAYAYPSVVPPGIARSVDDPWVALEPVVCLPRDTEDPKLPLPSYYTVDGGTEPDPVYGVTALCQFASVNALAKSLDAPDASFHGSVHRTVAGDLGPTFTSARDPVFWPWHNFLEVEVFQKWENECESRAQLREVAVPPPAMPSPGILGLIAVLFSLTLAMRRSWLR